MVAKDVNQWITQKKKFPKGTKVQLVSGGPIMAVKGYADEGLSDLSNSREIICQWFSGKKLEQGRFAPEALILVVDDKGQESSQ